MATSIPLPQMAIELAMAQPANQLIIDMGDTEHDAPATNIPGTPTTGPLITAFIMDDFSYSLGNKWEAIWDDLFGTTTSIIQSTQQFMKSEFGLEWGSNQVMMKNVNQTINQWGGSERLSFVLPLVFVATKNTDDVTAPILALNRMANANFNPSDAQILMQAPRGYSGGPVVARGCLGFKYGQWFATPRIFVVRKFTPVFSKLTIMGQDGKERPVMAAAQLDIEAYRLISGIEFNSFFINSSNIQSNFYNPNGYDPKTAIL